MRSAYERPGTGVKKVMGHRGWMAKFPENTLAGFKAACELGVDFVELDIHVTADGQLAVIHDEDTHRTTGTRGSVREMTLDRLKKLDAGRWFDESFAGERIPILEEVMTLVDGRVGLAIEVKPPRGTEDVLDEKLIPLVRSFDGAVVVHSFDGEYAGQLKAKAPDICVGQLCRIARKRLIRETKEAGIEAIHPAWRTLTGRMAREARKAGLAIMIWSARSHRDCVHMARKDCDLIGADCPDVLIQVLSERR